MGREGRGARSRRSSGREASPEEAIVASWDANADAWTAVVRGQRIPSRRGGTDAAIVDACIRLAPGRVLDVGCGEGWLARALAEHGADVAGIDGSAALIERARESGGGARFEVVGYDRLTADRDVAAGPWDLVVCNFALLGDRVQPLLAALAARLRPAGALLVQTVHPWEVARADPPYEDGWRLEKFASLPTAFAPMPWYFRTLESWVTVLHDAGLVIVGAEEPRDAATGRRLSLLFTCRRR